MSNPLDNRTIHVVAWRSTGSGGFDWFRTASAADENYELEKLNAIEYAESDWTAYRFDVKVPIRLSDAAVTDLIDSDLDHYCNKAEKSFKAGAAQTSHA